MVDTPSGSLRLLRAPVSLAGAAVTGGTLLVTGLTGYLAGLSAVAATQPTAVAARNTPPPASPRRFAIMVPAHDEAAVIARALQSFARLDYPAGQFEVHVVADNCSDTTAEIVRAHGYEAHERHDTVLPGKGPALNWLFQRLVHGPSTFDSIVIVDADTTVHPAFLGHLAAALDGGAVAAQAYYGVRDASDSPAAALRQAALACRHHLRPLGRTILGGSSGLYGNGMAFDVALMRDRTWTGHLTEDMEFQMELLLDGHRVVYVPGAMLEAEMPDDLEAATSQNERWELGRIEMARRYVPTLLRRIVRRAEPVAGRADRLRIADADAVMDHLVPPMSVMIAANGAFGLASLGFAVLRRHRIDRMNVVLSGASFIMLTGHVLLGLRSVGAPPSVYRSLRSAPGFVLWKLRLWSRMVTKPEAVEWKRTTRNVEAS